MARYIDELDDEGRDRLVAAGDFTSGIWWNGSCGCLVATGEGAKNEQDAADRAREKGMTILTGHGPWAGMSPAWRYAYAVTRFGKARVVRAIKARASSGMSREYEAPPAAVDVGQ
jgi:hypothetical protein